MFNVYASKPNPGPGAIDPNHMVMPEPSPRRVRVIFNGETIADSTRMLLVHETGHFPIYYFPQEDVRLDLLERTEHSTHCPYKGDASYLTVQVGGRQAENAAWTYESPLDSVISMKNYIAFYWDKMDHWYEEDDEVFVHARDPYMRIDVVNSSRPVRVVLGGETVAETARARFLYQTGLPTRYYIPRDDVRLDLLEPSESETICPYKGTARYHLVRINGRLYKDMVWYYPDPIPECSKIKDYLCFYNERVDMILVDGEEMPRPHTKWSED